MTTDYTIIKELKERIVLLNHVTEQNETDYNNLMENYAKQVRENLELRQNCLESKNWLYAAKTQNSANLMKKQIESAIALLP